MVRHEAFEEKRRVFFALWPDDSVAEALASLQRRCELRGKPVLKQNLHITLAFIGDASPDYLACLQKAAGAISFAPFTLTLDTLGYFKKPRIAWVGPTQVPAPLLVLQQTLDAELQACGYAPESRVFRPHVTLARKAEPVAATGVEPLRWPVREFVLAESQLTEDGPLYRVLSRYPAQLQM